MNPNTGAAKVLNDPDQTHHDQTDIENHAQYRFQGQSKSPNWADQSDSSNVWIYTAQIHELKLQNAKSPHPVRSERHQSQSVDKNVRFGQSEAIGSRIAPRNRRHLPNRSTIARQLNRNQRLHPPDPTNSDYTRSHSIDPPRLRRPNEPGSPQKRGRSATYR